MRKVIIVLGIILFSVIITTIGIYGYYYYSMKSANQEHYEKWFKEDFFTDSYTGIVSEIQNFDNDYNVISVSVSNENDRVYNLCKKIDVKKGDTIVKENNNFNLFKIYNGKKNLLKYNFCKD